MAHTGGTVTIAVNGERRRVAAGLSLAGLATELGLEPEKVAVERNRAIVPRSTLAEVGIEHGDELEIVHFGGGGDHARPVAEDTWSGGGTRVRPRERRRAGVGTRWTASVQSGGRR